MLLLLPTHSSRNNWVLARCLQGSPILLTSRILTGVASLIGSSCENFVLLWGNGLGSVLSTRWLFFAAHLVVQLVYEVNRFLFFFW